MALTTGPVPRCLTELGGAVLSPPRDMPDGRQPDVADPQGVMFSLIKAAAPESRPDRLG